MQPLRFLAFFSLFASTGLSQIQPPLSIAKTGLNNAFKLQWQSITGRSYFIQHSGDLSQWNYFPEVMAGIGGDDWMGVASDADKRFFRLVWSGVPTIDPMTADHDGDGIPSFAELTITNTDPIKYSTAGNGISDRTLFPNPQNGIYIDSSNAIQYVILPNSPGTTGSPTIMATHYFEAPDYVIEFKKGESSLQKRGFTEFASPTTPTNSTVRYLKRLRQISIIDTATGNKIPPSWDYGYTWTSTLPIHKVVIYNSNDYDITGANPISGIQTTTGGTPNTGNLTKHLDKPDDYVWQKKLPNWRWYWVNPSINPDYYDIPPFGNWEGNAWPYYEEFLYEENTFAKMLVTAQANRPAYALTWTEGNPWASWDHWGNELGLSYSRFKFRIRNKNGISDGEPAQVFVYFDPEGGEREEVLHVEWDGQGTTSPEYEIDPATLRPGVEGTFHLNAGSMFFELDLAQADARKAGETVMIPLVDEGVATNTMLQSVTALTSNPGTSAKIMFPGMDDTWYDGATITLSQTGGTGALRFRAIDPNSGYEVDVPMGQNLAPDFFESRGRYSGFDWKIEGADTGSITVQLSYSKGATNLAVSRTAVVLGKSTLLTDIDNDGDIDGDDAALKNASLVPGASSVQIEAGTEYLFFNDNLSNGAWDKGDSDPSKPIAATEDDDAQAISLHAGITEGEVWFTHPAIAGLSFYSTRDCNIADRIEIHEGNRFIIVPNRPLPSTIYVRADGSIAFPSDLQVSGDLVLNLKYSANDPVIALAALKLTVVKEFGATQFFQAANDYILENNTELFVQDKSIESTVFRLCLMREEATTMHPFELFEPAYENWLESGASPPFDAYIHREAAGISEVMANDMSMTVVINGNQCGFSSGMTSAEAAALSMLGEPQITDRCQGRIKELSRPLSSVSSDHYDETTNAPGTNMKGSRLAGPDPIPGSSPARAGGKFVAQYSNGAFSVGLNYAPDFSPSPNPSSKLSEVGGLSSSYNLSDRSDYNNSIVGLAPLSQPGKGMVFVAMGKDGTIGKGKTVEFYNAAVSSGVPLIAGATVEQGALPPIQALFLDSGVTSCGLAHKNPNAVLSLVYKGSKHNGMPYYTNTFVRFKSTKPRP